MILVVDNHGFTTNILTHQLGACHMVTAAELVALNLSDYTHLVLAHGTDQPDLTDLHNFPQLPVLAIGSSYQHLAAAHGHTRTAPAQPAYGQPVRHHHDGQGLLAGLLTPQDLITYHPWRLTEMEPTRFNVHAVDDENAVLVYNVTGTKHWGMHCDPAALQSEGGQQLIQNFLALHPQHNAPSPQEPTPRVTQPSIAVYTRTIPGQLNTAATFQQLQDGASAAFWLDSSAAHLGQGHTSMMGTNTGQLAQTVRWDVTTGQIDVLQGEHHSTSNGDILDYLAEHSWRPEYPLELPGFTSGWVGYLGYEAQQITVAHHTNRFRAATPDAYWIRPQTFLRYDHRKQVTTLIAFHEAHLLEELAAVLVFGSSQPEPPVTSATIAGRWRLTSAQYQQRITHIQQLLATGEAAGICLTDTFTLDNYPGDGLTLYNRLRINNPAPYAGYLRFNTFGDQLEILSASPEKFLGVEANGALESKPIKGTVARSLDPAEDIQIATEMASDPKIQSENLMITDLLRDDLARVSTPGSVQVPKLMAVETFATVHQLVTTVTGQLRPGATIFDALRAVFPGGSMTGAPRQVSLEVLETLEAGPRGIYSGTMGWLGDNNTAELNVIIRSIILDSGKITIGGGGAIVTDSDPAAEDAEKLLKTHALMDSIAQSL